jgi:co-chaperonin GroES (HSP10)
MKAVSPKRVAIEALPMVQENLKASEQSMEAKMKKQNRGTVLFIGKDCNPWIQVGDVVSFYRAAATTIKVDGKDVEIVSEDHILAKF